MLKRFKIGGIHPHDSKFSAESAIEVMPVGKKVYIPLAQHIGAPAMPTVAKGDKVVVGQKIGELAGFVSAAIHSSVSGTVASVEMVADGSGIKKNSVVINVEDDIWSETIDRSSTLITEITLEPKAIIEKIKESGIVGMGGATFPTHVKLSPPPGKVAEYLIINAVECEPYLTADDRVMREKAAEVVVGAEILLKALSAKKAFIGIENNKPTAIKIMNEAVAKSPNIEVVPLRVQYPQGGEKQLIDAVISRQVPSGALPIETGAVVQNVGTVLAVYEAVQKNKPLLERVVTITGQGANAPKNLLVRIGTPVSEVIEYAGGMKDTTAKVIGGGPMMGRAMCNINAPIAKGSSGILILEDDMARRSEAGPCISCAKCVAACPMGLEPFLISQTAKRGAYSDCEAMYVTDCIECGSCSYSCPAKISLLDYIKVAKAEVMQIIRSRK